MLLIYSCLINAVVATTSDHSDSSRCDHDGDLISLLQSLGPAASAGNAMSMPVQDAFKKAQTQQPRNVALDIGAEQHPAVVAAVAAPTFGRPKDALAQQMQHSNVVPAHASGTTGAGAWLIPLVIGFCIVAVAILLTAVACRYSSNSVAKASELERETSPQQVSLEDQLSDDFFLKRGIDLPSHLSTNRGRWKSLIVIAVLNALVVGPITSWPTFEPILKDQGVFAGPHQDSQLTLWWTTSTSVGVMTSLFAGVGFDAVGPRAMTSAAAFLAVACHVGMAIGVQFQSLNFLLWICCPALNALGVFVLYGGFAWMLLLPGCLQTVSGLVNGCPILAGSCGVFAALIHKEGLSLSFFYAVNAFFALLTGIAALMIIPEHTILQEIASVDTSLEVNVQSASDGATDSSVKRPGESPWDVVKRSVAGIRDSCTCLLWLCPGASFLFICWAFFVTMSAIYPFMIMLPFYQALLGPAVAITLVNEFSLTSTFGGAVLLFIGGFCCDYAGFAGSLAFNNFPIILQFALFCLPSAAAQIVGQVVNKLVLGILVILIPRWCLSYGPPGLFGTTMGVVMAVVAVLQMITTPLATTVGKHIDELAADHLHPVVAYQISIGFFCFMAIMSSLAYLQFLWFYPMPASGGTPMIEVATRTKDAKDV